MDVETTKRRQVASARLAARGPSTIQVLDILFTCFLFCFQLNFHFIFNTRFPFPFLFQISRYHFFLIYLMIHLFISSYFLFFLTRVYLIQVCYTVLILILFVMYSR